MNTTELIKALAQALNISQKQAHNLLHRYFETISKNLVEGHRIVLRGFGTFEITQTKPRNMRHPTTGKIMHIPPRNALHFRPAQHLKDEAKKWNAES